MPLTKGKANGRGAVKNENKDVHASSKRQTSSNLNIVGRAGIVVMVAITAGAVGDR